MSHDNIIYHFDQDVEDKEDADVCDSCHNHCQCLPNPRQWARCGAFIDHDVRWGQFRGIAPLHKNT